MEVTKYLLIGTAAGLAAGFFGIGGGIIIVPLLVYWVGLSQHLATGTSLAVLLPPIGILAVWQYYQKQNVDIYAAMWIAGAMVISSYVAAIIANKVKGPQLQLGFAIFIIVFGCYIAYGAVKKIWFTVEA